MKSETRKIALACFIGGALLVAVALVVAPYLWWLGILAGAIGGYLSYEFRSVLQAIPLAWAKTRAVLADLRTESIIARRDIADFLRKPHPVGYLSVILFPLMTYAGIFFLGLIFGEGKAPGDSLQDLCVSALAIAPTLTTFSFFLFLLLAESSAARDKGYFMWSLMNKEDVEKLEKEGFRQLPCNYGDVYRRIAIEFIRVMGLLIFWAVLGPFVLIYRWVLRPLGIFLKFLFIAIHSYKRLLCAVDGTIGGLIIYFNFARQATLVPEQILFVICGGLLGAGLGILNWEIVSVRVLKVAHVRA